MCLPYPSDTEANTVSVEKCKNKDGRKEEKNKEKEEEAEEAEDEERQK